MTEEIIIDVTKCEFNTFDGGGSQRTICTLDNYFCDGIRPKECYFKQLQRLKQENETNLKQIELDVDCIANYVKEVKKLNKENAKLKEEFEKTSNGFLKIQYKLANNCDNYRKALEEIREYCLKPHKFNDCERICCNGNCEDYINSILSDIEELLGGTR